MEGAQSAPLGLDSSPPTFSQCVRSLPAIVSTERTAQTLEFRKRRYGGVRTSSSTAVGAATFLEKRVPGSAIKTAPFKRPFVLQFVFRGLTYVCVLAPDELIGPDGFVGQKGSSDFEPDLCSMEPTSK